MPPGENLTGATLLQEWERALLAGPHSSTADPEDEFVVGEVVRYIGTQYVQDGKLQHGALGRIVERYGVGGRPYPYQVLFPTFSQVRRLENADSSHSHPVLCRAAELEAALTTGKSGGDEL